MHMFFIIISNYDDQSVLDTMSVVNSQVDHQK